MKFLFVVQSEGRGHCIQAIRAFKILRSQGHQVEKILVGKKARDFLDKTELKEYLKCIESPNLYFDKKHKLSLVKTTFYNTLKVGRFLDSVNILKECIDNYKINKVVNFFDPLPSLYKLIHWRCKVPFYCIAHQYVLLNELHPTLSSSFSESLLRFYYRLTTYGHTKIGALSFKSEVNLNKKLTYLPPLIREEVLFNRIRSIKINGLILIYLTEVTELKSIIEWHQNNPQSSVVLFAKVKPKYNHINFKFYEPDPDLFMYYLKACDRLICTSGFELICEATILRKSIYSIPVKEHKEQLFNAKEIEYYKIGKTSNTFTPSLLLDIGIGSFKNSFVRWAMKSEKHIIEFLEIKEKQETPIINLITSENVAG